MDVVTFGVAVASRLQSIHVAVRGHAERLREFEELVAQAPEDMLDEDALERFDDALRGFGARTRACWLDERSRYTVRVDTAELDEVLAAVRGFLNCNSKLSGAVGDGLVSRFRERARNGEAVPRGALEDLVRVVRRMRRETELGVSSLLENEAALLAHYLDSSLDPRSSDDPEEERDVRGYGPFGDPPAAAEISDALEAALELCVEPFPANIGMGEEYALLCGRIAPGSLDAVATLPRVLWSSPLAAGFLGVDGRVTWGTGPELVEQVERCTASAASEPRIAEYRRALAAAAENGNAIVSFVARSGVQERTRGLRWALGLRGPR